MILLPPSEPQQQQYELVLQYTMTSEGKSHQSYTESDDIALNDCWIVGMEHINKDPKLVTEFKLSCFVSTMGTFGTSPAELK